METRSYCVYNRTRESFLSLGVTPADTVFTRLKGLIGRFKLGADEGIWVVPSSGVHTLGVFFPVDLVYLDEEHKVIHTIEHFPSFHIAPIRTKAASVLELPTHTIYASQTQPGDQMLICGAEAMEERLRELSTDRSGDMSATGEIEGNGMNAGGSQMYGRSRDRAAAAKEDEASGLLPGGGALGFVMRARGVLLALAGRCKLRHGSIADSREVSGSATEQGDITVAETYVSKSGQALIEYALLVPLLFLLVVNTVNFGGFFYGWITMANAARAGADYAILGGASVGDLQPATAAQLLAMIQQDVSSLPNSSTLTVSVCQNNNGTVTSVTGSCSAIPSDPEPTNYVLTTVDVTYTYKPLMPAGFQFPGLNIYATLPPTTIHRRAVMRSIQ